MASVVSIKITLDNSQALPAIDQVNKALSDVGVKGTASFQQAGNGARTMGGHVSTGLDSVRLLSQEFGLRLPRAIEAMLSRMPAVTQALSGMLGVMAGIVAAQVFVHVAEEAYKAYEQYISLNAAADKFYETLKKTAQEDIVNTRSLETTRRRLDDATSGGTTNQRAAQAMQRGGIGDILQGNIAVGIGGLIGAHSTMSDAVEAQSNMVKLGKVDLDQSHQRALAQIDLNHAMDATLGGTAKIAAEAAKKKQIDAENRTFDRRQEMYYGNVSPGDAGSAEQQQKDATADAEAAAQNILLARKERDERITAQDAAIEAGLEGEAKYAAARDASISAINRKFMDGEISQRTALSVTASLSEKYDNERATRFQLQWQQAQEATRQAQQQGLTGGAQISAEHNNAIDKINSDRTLQPEVAAQLRTAASTSATQKMQQLEDNFANHVRDLDAQRVESSLSAYAKIDASAQKQIADLQKLYDDDFNNAELSDNQKSVAAQNLQSGITAITAAAIHQRQQLAQQNAADDLRYDQQASQAEARVRENGLGGWVASYKNAITEIQAQEAARLAKLQEDVTKEGLTQQEASQRQSDIVREANANIEEQNQQMQQKIAGNLQQAFTNPVEFIKSQMEKMFFEILAGWIMRMNVFKTLFGQTMGSLQPGAAGAGSAGGILGGVAQSIPGMRGVVNGAPNISSIYGPASNTATSVGHPGSSIGSTIGEATSAARTIGNLPGISGSSTNSAVLAEPTFPASSPDVSITSLPNVPASGSSTGAGTASGASGASGTSSQLMGIAGAGMAAYGAEQSTVKAFESDNPLQGALADAGAGAAIGSLAGPLGTVIGAGVGAAVGASAGLLGMATGEGNNLAARAYYEQSVLPTLEADMRNPNGDFQSAASDVGNTSSQALAYMTTKFGKDAADWVNSNYMAKETAMVLKRIEDTAAGGRQYVTMSAAQFHSGGTITDFGSLGTSTNEGFIHAMLGETVMNPAASNTHAAALSAMQGGASHNDIASMYLAGSRSPSAASTSSGGDTHHWNINALDPKSFDTFLKNGGARTITKRLNTYNSQYAGDGISG